MNSSTSSRPPAPPRPAPRPAPWLEAYTMGPCQAKAGWATGPLVRAVEAMARLGRGAAASISSTLEVVAVALGATLGPGAEGLRKALLDTGTALASPKPLVVPCAFLLLLLLLPAPLEPTPTPPAPPKATLARAAAPCAMARPAIFIARSLALPLLPLPLYRPLLPALEAPRPTRGPPWL